MSFMRIRQLSKASLVPASLRTPTPIKITSNAGNIPESTVPTVVPSSDFGNYKASFSNSKQYYQSLPRSPIHADPSRLPQVATDIKGVDAAVYQQLRNNKLSKLIPRVTNNRFFSLKYYPADHYIAKFRKSTIAYTFTNKGGYKLNSLGLENALQSYKGKYRNETFFKENSQPLETSVGRTKYRRLIKQTLFQSIKTNSGDVRRLAGVFRFTFLHVPRSPREKLFIRTEMDSAVKKIIRDTRYQKELTDGTSKSNQLEKEIRTLMNNVSWQNSIGAKERKLPFAKGANSKSY